MKTAIVSIDFDYFIREKTGWDWGHCETNLHLNQIWDIRYSTDSIDIKKETDPAIYADFMPDELKNKLAEKNLFLNDFTSTANAESHLAILEFFKAIGYDCDLFINIDAHHDLFGGETHKTNGGFTCENWWFNVLAKNPTAKHIWIYPNWLSDKLSKAYMQAMELPRPVKSMTFSELNLSDDYAIKGLFFCRSGCWVPPHLDPLFNQMCCSFTSNLFMPEREYHIDHKLKAEVQKLREKCF